MINATRLINATRATDTTRVSRAYLVLNRVGREREIYADIKKCAWLTSFSIGLTEQVD
jgi:hypothetical protein